MHIISVSVFLGSYDSHDMHVENEAISMKIVGLFLSIKIAQYLKGSSATNL